MGGEDGEPAVSEDDLLASFPNLRALRPQGPPEAEWSRQQLPGLTPEAENGVLSNGLTWVVHENHEPKERAALYLIVGFGSLVEEEEERGIAHIIEHLGFSATKAYENHAIVKFLESIGAPFGACQNAYTSFDRTVYTLHVPTDKEGLLTESLTVLREFAYFTRISEEDLEKERKVVLEEWRESKNAQGRLFEQYIQALCKGCKWCERLPIGKEEVIRGVSAETLRRFYRKFYHPSRMAVVAVGDFKGKEVAAKIRELFDIEPGDIEPLPRSPKAPERPWHAVPDSEGVAVASSTDPELSFAQGMVDCKRPKQPSRGVLDFRRHLCEEIFHKALSSRLLKLTIEPQGPRNVFMVSTETGEPIPALNPMSITIAPLPGRMREALKGIAREIERVKRLGFHEAEVTRAKRSLLARFEEEYIERKQRPSESFAEEYVSFFLDDVPAPSIEQRATLAAGILPSIASEEVMKVAAAYDFERNVVVKLATPPMSVWNPLYTGWSLFQAVRHLVMPRLKLDLPSSAEVSEIFQSVAQEALEPWPQDEDDVDSRLKKRFEECEQRRKASAAAADPGCGKPARAVEATGVPHPKRGSTAAELHEASSNGDAMPPIGEEVTLPNGMRVFFKDTDLFDDEIILCARRWGGLSEHQAKSVLGRGVVSCEAQVCSMSAMMLGICGLSMESLQECLDGKRVDPNPPELEAYSTGLSCSASPVDFEALLTLLYLLFMSPVDAGAKSRGRLSLVKLGLLAWRLGENRDPQAQFSRRVQRLITQDHPFSRLPSLWSILNLDFRRASAIFNERASMPCEWTFVIVGRLPKRDSLLQLLSKYLGSIPNEVRHARELGSPARPWQELTGAEREVAMRQAVTPLDVKFPERSVREEVRLQMVDAKGSTVLCFPLRLQAVSEAGSPTSAENELKELFRLRLLVRLLETRLIEVLRFKRGQVYGVSVSDDLSLSPPQLGVQRRGTIAVGFECDPDEADGLVAVTREELQRLRSGEAAFTPENVSAALEQEKREFEECFQKNDWWAGTILDLYFSRCNAVTGEVGATVALWWRIRAEVVGGFDAETAGQVLHAVLPEGAANAVITMRPKGGRPKPAAGGAPVAPPAVAPAEPEASG